MPPIETFSSLIDALALLDQLVDQLDPLSLLDQLFFKTTICVSLPLWLSLLYGFLVLGFCLCGSVFKLN